MLIITLSLSVICAIIIFIAVWRKSIKNATQKVSAKTRGTDIESDCINLLFFLHVETKETSCTDFDSNDYRPLSPISAYIEIGEN